MSTKSPMQILKAVSPVGAQVFLDLRKATMDNPALAELPLQQKLLIGIGVAVALGASTCTLAWTRQVALCSPIARAQVPSP